MDSSGKAPIGTSSNSQAHDYDHAKHFRSEGFDVFAGLVQHPVLEAELSEAVPSTKCFGQHHLLLEVVQLLQQPLVDLLRPAEKLVEFILGDTAAGADGVLLTLFARTHSLFLFWLHR